MIRTFPTALTLLAFGCGSGSRPAQPAPDERLPVERILEPNPSYREAPVAEHEVLWRLTIMFYLGSSFPTEADLVDRTASLTGSGPRKANEGRAPVILLTRRPAKYAPFRSEWLQEVAGRHNLALCDAATARDCPQPQLATFLQLRPPLLVSPDTAVVQVDETALSTADCRQRPSFVGFNGRALTFVRAPSDQYWRYVGPRRPWPLLAGSGPCGPR